MSRLCRKTCTDRNMLRNCSSNDDLCAFYKNKLKRMEDKFAELWDMLERFNGIREESSTLNSELQARTLEVNRLQFAVSDLQVFLFREREENLKLASENDKLRIEDYENKKAIQILLKLCGLKRNQLNDLMSTSSSSFRPEKEESSPTKDSLLLEVKSLKTQLENLKTLFRNEVDVLLKDREVVAEERANETKRLHNHLTILADNLRRMQESLKEASCRVLKFEENELRGDNVFDRRDDPSTVTLNAIGSSRSLKSCGTRILQTRLDDQEKLCHAYQQQCKHLEIEMKRWKERAEIAEKNYREKTQSLSSDLAVMRNRYEELDRRRILEAEGFRTDIKLLRERLNELNRQIIKVKNNTVATVDEDLKASTQLAFKRAQQFEKEVAALKLKFMTLTRD